jgi:hypothetical protein
MDFSLVHRWTLVAGLATALAGPPAFAAPEPPAALATDEMPMVDYLTLLERIAPSAQEGAMAYLEAFRRRCGRTLQTVELRRAMAEGSGDPLLMAMIRASHLRDAVGVQKLGTQVACSPRSTR